MVLLTDIYLSTYFLPCSVLGTKDIIIKQINSPLVLSVHSGILIPPRKWLLRNSAGSVTELSWLLIPSSPMDTLGKKKKSRMEGRRGKNRKGRKGRQKKRTAMIEQLFPSFYSESSIISGNFRDFLISKCNCYLLGSRHDIRLYRDRTQFWTWPYIWGVYNLVREIKRKH